MKANFYFPETAYDVSLSASLAATIYHLVRSAYRERVQREHFDALLKRVGAELDDTFAWTLFDAMHERGPVADEDAEYDAWLGLGYEWIRGGAI